MEEKLALIENKYEELCARSEQPDFYADPKLAAKYLKEQRELEPVVTAFRAWKKAKADMADALTAYDEIDAVFSLDDETSIGALQAILEAERTDVKAITGGGGCQEYFQLIAENKDIAVSSSLYSPLMIRDCFDVALAKLAGEEVQAVTVIPSQIVDASNVEEYIDPSNTIY